MDESLWKLEDSNLTLETIASGYSQTYQGLPEGDIFITLTSQKATKSMSESTDAIGLKEWVIFFLTLATLCGLGYIGLLLLKRRGKL